MPGFRHADSSFFFAIVHEAILQKVVRLFSFFFTNIFFWNHFSVPFQL